MYTLINHEWVAEHLKIDIPFTVRWRTQQNVRVEFKICEPCYILNERVCFICIMKTVQPVFSNAMHILFLLHHDKETFFIIAAPSSMAFFGLAHHMTIKCNVCANSL